MNCSQGRIERFCDSRSRLTAERVRCRLGIELARKKLKFKSSTKVQKFAEVRKTLENFAELRRTSQFRRPRRRRQIWRWSGYRGGGGGGGGGSGSGGYGGGGYGGGGGGGGRKSEDKEKCEIKVSSLYF